MVYICDKMKEEGVRRVKEKLYIGVIGGSYDIPEDEREKAFELGKLIAEEGWVILCGGGGGIMEEVSRGASEKGGTIIGILPGPSRAEGNRFLTYALPTALGAFRNFLIAQASDIIVALEGKYGTLSEIAIALRLGKTVISLAGWELGRKGFKADGIYEASSPKEAIDLINKLLIGG